MKKMFHTIKQLEEKNVGSEIDILLWSDKMDLVAFSNAKGEVALHRLSWVRAWSLSPPKEGLLVKGLAWRPDGRVLAIAYSSGEILLINVENKAVLHRIEIEDDISCIFWIREKIESKTNSSNLTAADEEEQTDYMKHLDYSSKYLPDLPPLSNLGLSGTNSQDENLNSNLFHDQKELNLLIVGTQSGFLHISIFGQFPCAVLKSHIGCKCSIISAHLSDDLSLMFITVKDESNSIKIILLNTFIFKTHSKELFAVALKHGHLNSLLTYLSNVIIPIKETWETILLEMDAKLSKYASKVPEGTLTADFLDLLMFGITSDEMQEFLLQDLTEKGLKKFGQIIEMCYANIQKLLLKHVTKAGQNITYHLAELRGMARLEHRYKMVGLSEETITEAIGANGSFLTKGGEMHQIINHFMINYKAFFRWLYTAILHLMDIPLMPDMPKNTQQDVAHIAEFILNFDNIGAKNPDGTVKKPQFIMERLGQYLNDSPLTIQPDIDENLWECFLAQNECIRDHPTIIRRYKSFSLIQQFKHLVASVESIFTIPKDLITNQFSINRIINCLNLGQGQLNVTKINSNSEGALVAFLSGSTSPTDGLYFLEVLNTKEGIVTKCAYVYFRQTDSVCENYCVSDIKFYSANVLSILLQESSANRTGILYQFPIASFRERLIKIDTNKELTSQHHVPKINGLDLGVGVLKQVEGMICSQFAVSGCRRVSIVLSENRKKVRLFEMEAEEDDEEDADMTNSARESDTSMQEENSFVE